MSPTRKKHLSQSYSRRCNIVGGQDRSSGQRLSLERHGKYFRHHGSDVQQSPAHIAQTRCRQIDFAHCNRTRAPARKEEPQLKWQEKLSFEIARVACPIHKLSRHSLFSFRSSKLSWRTASSFSLRKRPAAGSFRTR